MRKRTAYIEYQSFFDTVLGMRDFRLAGECADCGPVEGVGCIHHAEEVGIAREALKLPAIDVGDVTVVWASPDGLRVHAAHGPGQGDQVARSLTCGRDGGGEGEGVIFDPEKTGGE